MRRITCTQDQYAAHVRRYEHARVVADNSLQAALDDRDETFATAHELEDQRPHPASQYEAAGIIDRHTAEAEMLEAQRYEDQLLLQPGHGQMAVGSVPVQYDDAEMAAPASPPANHDAPQAELRGMSYERRTPDVAADALEHSTRIIRRSAAVGRAVRAPPGEFLQRHAPSNAVVVKHLDQAVTAEIPAEYAVGLTPEDGLFDDGGAAQGAGADAGGQADSGGSSGLLTADTDELIGTGETDDEVATGMAPGNGGAPMEEVPPAAEGHQVEAVPAPDADAMARASQERGPGGDEDEIPLPPNPYDDYFTAHGAGAVSGGEIAIPVHHGTTIDRDVHAGAATMEVRALPGRRPLRFNPLVRKRLIPRAGDVVVAAVVPDSSGASTDTQEKASLSSDPPHDTAASADSGVSVGAGIDEQHGNSGTQ